MVDGVVNALGEPAAHVSPLGEGGRTAPAPSAEAVFNKPAGAPALSRDTITANPEHNPQATEADKTRLAAAAKVTELEGAIAKQTDPAAKARLEAELKALKPPVDADAATKAAAITAAEKALADAKTPDAKAAAQAALDKLKAPVALTGAPEVYSDFKLPEGFKPDAAALSELTPLFKELNLSQAGVEKLLAAQAVRMTKTAAEAAKNHVVAWNKLMGDRLKTAQSDPEVGGSGNPDVFKQSVADAREGIRAFGTSALQAYLNTSEAGSHVEVIRALAAAGRAVKNDTLHLGGAPVKAEPKTLADRLFPKTAAKK